MNFLDITVNVESVYISTALVLRYIVMTASVGIAGPLCWAAPGGGAGERIFIKTPSQNTMNTSVPPHTAGSGGTGYRPVDDPSRAVNILS